MSLPLCCITSLLIPAVKTTLQARYTDEKSIFWRFVQNIYFSSSTKNYNAHKNDVVSVFNNKSPNRNIFGLQDLAFDTLQGWNGIKYQYGNILYWLSLVIHF